VTEKIRVYIADDYPVLRDGMKAVFASQPGFDVVGEAGDGIEALEGIARLKPDVVIMDITMPRLNGIVATKRIGEEHPDVKVIILSMHADTHNAIDAFRAGACGYILKDSASEDILEAVRKVNGGAKYASPAVADGLLDGFVEIIKKDRLEDPFDTLSQREREVLKMIADGATSREVAEKLFVSVSTIKSHRNNIMKKLRVHDVASLIKVAIRKGVVTSE
jgi:two-component system response regulator NreC